MDLDIRLARPDDGGDLQAIYAPIVEDTVISFEIEPPTAEEMSRRVEQIMPRHPWLVVDQGGTVVGYAYASRHRDRQAYERSVDVSVYVHPDHHGRGIGRGLYTALLALVRRQGYRAAFAGVTLPNPASVGLHEAVGFTPVGVYRQVGWKRGAWRDVGWWQLALALPEEPLHPLRPVDELSEAELAEAIGPGLASLRS